MHIPVIIGESGIKDLVYNDFYIGENCDITIVAGCGIHNCGGGGDSQHDGIHTFYIGKNSKVRYIEKHFGEGDGRGKQIMNPTTILHLAEGAELEMETTQIAGIDDTIRETSGDLAEGAHLVIREKILTTGRASSKDQFLCNIWMVNPAVRKWYHAVWQRTIPSKNSLVASTVTLHAMVTPNVTPSSWTMPM